jgi:hypothetical protein
MARFAARHVENVLHETIENDGDKTGTTAPLDGQKGA